jgi:hypothetical protein
MNETFYNKYVTAHHLLQPAYNIRAINSSLIHFRFIWYEMSEKKQLKSWDKDVIIRDVTVLRKKKMISRRVEEF